MTTINTNELTKHALNWAVAVANGWHVFIAEDKRDALCVVVPGRLSPMFIKGGSALDWIGSGYWSPSTDWAQGGPIIERELIETAPAYAEDGVSATGWMAVRFNDERATQQPVMAEGPTPLVAAMRAYVASKLGPTVDVPAEVLP